VGFIRFCLTETTARKYFGDDDPIGKTIRINVDNGTDFQVTGVLKDVPALSHFTFDVLIPFYSRRDTESEWNWYSFYTYVRLMPNTDSKQFESRVKQVFAKHQPTSLNEFYIQPLDNIHLHSRLKWELSENGDIMYVNILLLIAMFVIVIAGINYVNLATAQSAKRAKEIGVRKVTGAVRFALIRQFLVESLMMSFLSCALSVIVTTLLLPFSKTLFGTDLSSFMNQSLWVKTVLPIVVFLIGFLAGLYPAFYLSSFQPLKVLRGRFLSSAPGIHLRQGLVVFQFIISTVLIVVTLIIQEQLAFMRQKKLGFDAENIVMLPNVRGGVGREFSNPESMAEDLKKIGAVQRVARADGIFGSKNAFNGVANKVNGTHVTLNFIRADYDFIPTFNIEVIEGRNFSPLFPSDAGAIIINQKAAVQLGLKQNIVGQKLEWDDGEGKTHDLTIVGVVNDFHFTSFHEEIKPFGFILEVNNGSTFFLKTNSNEIGNTLNEIEKVWAKHHPDKPFYYSFQNEYMAKLHLSEARFQRLFSCFTFLAIVIACLGLFGLVTALAEAKTKEIGIRKVLGSTVTGIVSLLTKQFIVLVIVAMIVSAPVAFIAADYWLQEFAYRIHIGWEVFVFGGMATIVVSFLTIYFQSIKAALIDPVKSLRNE
jgi:putative ABC transport system permease protein